MTYYRARSHGPHCPPLTHCTQPQVRFGMGDVPPTLQAKIDRVEDVADDLSRNWNPTGFYRPGDMLAIIASLRAIQTRVDAAIGQQVYLNASALSEDDKTMLRSAAQQATKQLLGLGKGVHYVPLQPMLDAITRAQQAGSYVDAPQFKRYVISYLYKASAALDAIAISRAGLTATQRFAEDLNNAYQSTAVVIRKVVGVTMDAIKAAGGAVVSAGGMLSSLPTLLMWGGLAYGVIWAVKKARGGG